MKTTAFFTIDTASSLVAKFASQGKSSTGHENKSGCERLSLISCSPYWRRIESH